MELHENNSEHLDRFVELNHHWITKYFSLEAADKKLAKNPETVWQQGGVIFSLVVSGVVVGVCAIFKHDKNEFELARMAVDEQFQGRGFGSALITAAIKKARILECKRMFLLSNTQLVKAIELYRRHGFNTCFKGPHPTYSRCNIVMDQLL